MKYMCYDCQSVKISHTDCAVSISGDSIQGFCMQRKLVFSVHCYVHCKHMADNARFKYFLRSVIINIMRTCIC